jgi:hypothetical protein
MQFQKKTLKDADTVIPQLPSKDTVQLTIGFCISQNKTKNETIKVHPEYGGQVLVKLATANYLLRPYFLAKYESNDACPSEAAFTAFSFLVG